MEKEDLDRAVLHYLQRRGFKQAEQTLKQEARIQKKQEYLDMADVNVANYILFYNEDEMGNPQAYENCYIALRKWIDDSIDAYKLELRRILFPLFVHAYLDLVPKGNHVEFFQKFSTDHLEHHSDHIRQLQALTSANLEENALVQDFRNSKYGVRMCKYSFELLLSFLQDNKFMLLLRLMNQYINIESIIVNLVATDKHAGVDENIHTGSGLVGEGEESVAAFNEQAVTLGQLPPDLLFLTEMERYLNAETDVQDAPAIKQQVLQAIQVSVDEDAPSRDNVPQPPKSLANFKDEIEYFRTLKERVALDANTLPSICCYTFHNTASDLNCIRGSLNGEHVAAGFSDSVIKLWSLRDRNVNTDKSGSGTNFVGHSGPVYGMDFSPDGSFLISGSQDKTARLWSTETKTNLVAYKGHNYPIFDVNFASQGLYFATASYDKTARLWSCDHIFPLRIFVGHLSDVTVLFLTQTVRFHPNCNYVLTGSSDQTCRLWDVQKGNCVRIFANHNGPVTAIAVNPDGRTMASAGIDKVIRLWDMGTGRIIKTMSGHTNTIHSLEFSRNGTLLASGGEDDSVRLWDVKKSNVDSLEIPSQVNRHIESQVKKYTD